MVCVMSSFQALLIDLHPGRSASAAASVCSLLRGNLITVEYCEMLVRRWGQCSYSTNVDKVECWVDIYFTCLVVCVL